ncbi:MAG: hypothetical protein O2894_01455 [Planctomycetota bacterium]|nr:hypothetical protein [Planctomycetota bacterium]
MPPEDSHVPTPQGLSLHLPGGRIHIDTRDITTLDPITGEPAVLATSGYVHPYLERSVLGGSVEADMVGGLAPRSGEVRVGITPGSNAVQLINHSVLEAGGGSLPLAVTFDVDVVGSDGSTVSSSVVGPIAGNATAFLPFTPPFGQVGFVRVRPMTAAGAGELYRFGLTAQENGFQNHVEGRYRDLDDSNLPGLVDLGFDVEFGTGAGGEVNDFGLLLSNSSASSQSVTMTAIYRRGGVPMLVAPRVFSLRSGRTVFLGTSDARSFGLEGAEQSWFRDLFGDVFAFGGFEAVTVQVQAPRDVDVSGRQMDAGFGSYYRVLPPYPRTNRACIFGIPVATSTLSGTRSWVVITNTTNGDLRVPVRAFTPGMGTEYILNDILVPARSRLDWSPDGIQLREEPTATVGPFVDRLRFSMTPSVGALFSSRVEQRDGAGLLLFIRPTIIMEQ